MGIFKRTNGGRPIREVDSKATRPIVLEKLEPRILLSGDGLLNIATDPLEDPLLDNKPLVVQNADLLDTNTQADEQVSSKLSDADIYEPILTLPLEKAEDDGQIGGNAELTDTDILPDDLDITLQKEQLLAAENDTYPENITSDSEESSSDLIVSAGYDDTTDQLTETLLAANPPPAISEMISVEYLLSGGLNAPASDAITQVDEADITSILDEAIGRWMDSGLVSNAGVFDSVSIVIGDLPIGVLGQTENGVISIDINADGHGWFVDTTPADDSEFILGDDGRLVANADGPAASRMDLLTVVLHELGHVAGFGHTDVLENDGPDVMRYFLNADVRLSVNATANPLEPGFAIDLPAFLLDEGANLNEVIDELLDSFDPLDPPEDGSVFTSGYVIPGPDGDTIPYLITIGDMDLQLENVTLTFYGLNHNGSWEGEVEVWAESATIFPGLLDIEVTDDDDADDLAVVGLIDLSVGNPDSFLSLDDLEEEDIGWVPFIDLNITDLRLMFPEDFRVNDAENDLYLSATFLRLDTGNALFNDLLSTSGVFELTVTGSVTGLKLDMDAIRQGIRDLVSGKISFPSSPIVGLGEEGPDGVSISGQITGKLFKVGVISGDFILKKLTYTPDDGGPDRWAVYLAWSGTFIMANEPCGGRSLILECAWAISTRGPLHFYFGLGTSVILEPTTGLTLEEAHLGVRFYTTIEGMQIETDFETSEVGVTQDGTGYRITLTIPGHDFEVGDYLRISNSENPNNASYNGDFEVLTVNGDQVTYWVEDDPEAFVGNAEIIRLTIKDPLDLLDVGLQSIAPPASMADWEDQLDEAVMDQLEDTSVLDSWASLFDNVVLGGGATLSIRPIPDSFMKYKVDFMIDTDFRIFMNGGMWLLNGVVKHSTRLYADLGDLYSGGRFLYLQTQYETSNFDIDPLLVYRGEVSFETLSGSEILGALVTENTEEGFWEIELELDLDNPSSEYTADVDYAVIYGSNSETFDGTYEVIAVNDTFNTITVKSMTNPGAVSGGKVTNENALIGFRIVLDGGVDLNIPGITIEGGELKPITVTTLTLEGEVWIEFKAGTNSDPEVKGQVELSLGFEAWLSESEFIDEKIAWAAGLFQLSVIVTEGPTLDWEDDEVELIIVGAAWLGTQFDFLEPFGLYMDASGLLRINSDDVERSITLTLEDDDNGEDDIEITVTLPAQSFAIRLDGRVDFRIDFNGENGFEDEESVFLIDGIIVLEFSGEQGFNVAVFREVGESVGPATLKLGPANSPFLQFDVFGFLAIRSNGVAANLILSLDVDLPGSLAQVAEIDGQFVFMLNTTGEIITFNIPQGADDRAGPEGLTVEIPRAPPASITEASFNVFDLIEGKAWTLDDSTPGIPYVLVLLGGTDPASNPDAIFQFKIGGFSLSGKFSLLASFNLSTSSIFLEMQFDARMELQPLNGLLLASGSLRIDDQGVVGSLMLGGILDLGPLTIVGAFTLEVNTTGNMQTVQRYEFDFVTEDFKRDAYGNPVIQDVDITAGTVSLFAFAKFKLTDSFVLQGSVSFEDNPDLLLLDINMTMKFFSADLNVNGSARIVKTGGSEGLVIKLGASLSADVFGVSGIFDFDAYLALQINTRPGDQSTPLDVNDLGLKRQTFRIAVSNAKLTLLSVVTLNGSGFVEVTQGVFRMQANLSGQFLCDNVTVTASAFFSSEGEFEVYMSADVLFGWDKFGLDASGWIKVSYLDDNGKDPLGGGNKNLEVTGHVSGSVRIIIPLGSVSVDVQYSESHEIYIHVSVTVLFITYSKNFYIGVFSVDPPPPIVLGQVSNGVLTLNVGPDAGARNLFVDEPDEDVLIEHVEEGSEKGEKIRITMFGHSEEFDNVLEILIHDMAAGWDYVAIGEQVSVPVEVHFGDDDDTLMSSGSGVVIAYGDDGSDILIGGPNADIINGGAGNDRIAGDLAYVTYNETGQVLQTIGSALGGNDTLYGNAGDDVILGGSGNDVINGDAGEDVLIGDDGIVTFSQELGMTYELTDLDFSGNDIIDGGDDNDTLYGQKGEDILLGGGGDDVLYGYFDDSDAFGTETARNILLGDSGDIIQVNGSVTIDTTGQAAGGADTIYGNGGADIAMGGAALDIIYGDDGDDILLGDTGIIELYNGSLVYVDTEDEESGGSDTIQGDMGDDIIIGGLNSSSDTLYGSAGNDIILGDNGFLDFSIDGDPLTLDLIRSATDGFGGGDIIYGNAGSDVILGGTGGDEIQGGDDPDILIGDNADIFLSGFVPGSLTILGSAVNEIVSTDTGESTGGADTIAGNEAGDIIIGGVNGSSDILYGNNGDDVIIGDNGVLDFAYNGDTVLTTLDLICSFTDGLGGGDIIYGNAGEDVLIGGTGGDNIDGGEGKDLILGDNGVLTYMNGDTSNPRFRVLEGTVMYGETDGVDDGLPLIDRDSQFNDPAGIPQWANWEVTLSVNSGGPDYIAGGPDNDQIFGQGDDDIIQGDGSIGTIDTPTAVNAYRNAEGLLVVSPSVENLSDGDDYIEGNDGDDVIFGNLGQDDIIGGSSELFGLDTAAERTDGQDMIFGGAGTDLARKDEGDTSDNGHARDADVILGDNGNIYRLVGTNGTDSGNFLEFNYDNYGTEKIIVRGAELLDYTPGGMDYNEANAANDIGAPDEIHGESGDDFLYGMKGDDVIFGEGQDDDIIGGYGNDWISGGTGDDGVLGDDGRIYTSRNGTAEPLYGIGDLAGELDKDIRTPDKKQQATINVSGKLKKTVNLTPFKLGDPEVPQYMDEFDPLYADDIIFGGWGNDFLHGGDGDDAISGAEALTEYYDNPVNPGNVLKFGDYREGEFGAYNRDDPLSKVYWNPETGEFGGTEEFLLNFDHTEGPEVNAVNTDGDDVIFGDLGNDWLVGGTGRDHLYGGRGCDLLNADDNLETAEGANNEPDGSETSYEDLAYGGAGSDVLIANIVGDRLIDWVGDFNIYVLPYTSFGANTISRNLKPRLFKFLYDLSRSDGADQTLGDSDDPRNGEPNGELGLVAQKDPDWENQQTPDDKG